MRRKRHHTWSKIIERLEVKPQVMQHHVQPSVWASSVASSTTCLIIVHVSKVSMIDSVVDEAESHSGSPGPVTRHRHHGP